MARSNHISNSFVAGEISPRAYGRTDIQQYNQGCEKLENMIVYPQGGASKRPGTIFVRDLARPDFTYPTHARVIPFSASDGTRWQIVITREPPYEQTVDGVAYYGWKAINVADMSVEDIRTTFSPGGTYMSEMNLYDLADLGVNLNEIQYAQSGDIIWLVHPLFPPLQITYDTEATYTFTADQYNIAFTSNDKWKGMPFLGEETISGNTYGLDLTTVVSSGTLAPSVGSSINFTAAWVGRVMQFTRTSSDTVVILIVGYNSAVSLDWIMVGGSAPGAGTQAYGTSGAPTYTYKYGAWDEIQGYPRTVCFFETRLIFGGTLTYPDTIWGSQAGDIYEFITTEDRLAQDSTFGDAVVATDPFVTTLNSEYLNQIRWVVPGKNISTGTNSREFIVEGPSDTSSIGPLNIGSHAETGYGAAYVQALRNENVVAFIDRSRRLVREMVFNFDEDSFKASNMNILADHIASKPLGDRDGQEEEFENCYFVAMANQQSKGVMWFLDNNGYLAGMTREREQQVVSWHRHKIAGVTTYNGANYDPFVQSISCVSKPESATPELGGEYDELWMVVKRACTELVDGGGTVEVMRLFIEKMSFDWEHPDITANWDVTSDLKHGPVYMDCAVLFDGADSDEDFLGTIQELPHSHGSTVVVVCDGVYFGEYEVSDGTIDISDQLTQAQIDAGTWKAIVGYNYIGDLIGVVPEVPAQLGSSQAQPRRIDQITLHFWRSLGCRFGRAEDENQDDTPSADMEVVSFPNLENAAATPLYTGEKKLVFPPGYEARPKVRVQSYLPFPMTLTHVVSRMVVYEG
jgi:hypothetical protein